MLICRIKNKDIWNQFVEQSPNGTIFDTSTWCDLFDREYGLLGCYKGDELLGGMVVYPTTDVSLTPYHGIILKDQSYEYSVSKA